MKRRHFIATALGASLAGSPLGTTLAAAQRLPRTPRDYEGPYYPVGPRHQTNDLLLGTPRQRVFELSGRVVGVDGAPLPERRVDIWHADPLGRYLHPRDTAPGARWDDFLYYGETLTAADGSFSFRTYLPGEYGRRPAHIHFKIWQGKRNLLTSQVYFSQSGGARGAARDDAAADLQTITLDTSGTGISGFLQVVI